MPCRYFLLLFFTLFWALLSYFKLFLAPFCRKIRNLHILGVKLSKADISAFFKLSTRLSISEIWIWKLSTNYRYRKMHQIWSDKYMKSQTIRNLVSANVYPKNGRKITPSCLFTMKSSTDSIIILCPVDIFCYFFLPYFEPFCRILQFVVAKSEIYTFLWWIIEKIIESR